MATNETKHTPGPWVLYDCDDLSNVGAPRHIHADCQAFKHRASSIVAVYGRDRPDEREANANLIAAAPDLLDALEEARDVLACAIRANWEGSTPDDIAEHVTIKRIDAAIAKATGSAA